MNYTEEDREERDSELAGELCARLHLAVVEFTTQHFEELAHAKESSAIVRGVLSCAADLIARYMHDLLVEPEPSTGAQVQGGDLTVADPEEVEATADLFYDRLLSAVDEVLSEFEEELEAGDTD